MKTFILDLDNTLIVNTPFYHGSTAELMAYIYAHKELNLVAPNFNELYSLIREIDDEKIRNVGFSMDRFPRSFVDTYLFLCEKRGIEPLEEEISEVRNIGESVFGKEKYEHYGLMPGVQDTLDFLVEQQAVLYTVTKGDLEEQSLKMEANNLFEYIEREKFFVSRGRKTEHFMNIREENKGIVYSVGDNPKHDIDDATEVGMHGIYIPGPGATKEIPGFEHPDRVLVYSKLSHIIETYDEL